MTNESQTQTEPTKMYRSWIGVVLSLFISGASQFLAGKRLQGVIWFVALPLLATASGWCLASPIVPGDLLGFILLGGFIILWIVMLIKSYRPVPRLRWIGWIGFVTLFLVFEMIDFHFIRPFKMPTSSMSPTIQGDTKRADGTIIGGDHVMVEEYAYWFNKPQRGDIIVFETKGISADKRESYLIPPNEFYIKRIAGIPGDVLTIQNGRLYNHGQILSSPSALAKLEFVASVANPIYLTKSLDIYKVPDGSYFLIGDNTTNSLDSRYFGAIPEKNIIGRVSKIYWPLNRAGKVE